MAGERTQRLDLRISPEEMSMLEALAEVRGLTVSDIVRTLIRREHRNEFGQDGKVKRP
jgi:uncharacterized protein (DUF1778 family)